MFNVGGRQGQRATQYARTAEIEATEFDAGGTTVGSSDGNGDCVSINRCDGIHGERLFRIENDVLEVVISDVGGAIKSAALKKYRATQDGQDPVIFNDGSTANAMAMSFGPDDSVKFPVSGKFDVTEATETSVKLVKSMENGCSVMRKYSIVGRDGSGGDGYVVTHEISVENVAKFPVNVGILSLFLGTMPATTGDSSGDYLNFGAFDGKKDCFVKLRDFKASNGVFGFGKKAERKKIFATKRILWGSVKNQFFTAILTPEVQADGYVAWPTLVKNKLSNKMEEGVAAAARFNVGVLDGGGKWTLRSNFYIGPKDFSRLSAFDKEQDRVMQFGFFGSISELLLRLMLKIHSLVPNWGLTIIVLTTIVKLLLWPLTNAQVRSSKKMASIQGPLKLIKEKFKNNPQKLQAETLKLFKENRINPAAGCLPIFIQIPIFFGLYYMLRTSSDLRFAHFLWISDLSLPDTMVRVGNFPINILPLIMGVTMFWQMHMTPIPAADNSQRMMFKLMPAIFLLCCYNFPSGLVLYWTVQNLLTIAQQLTMSRSGAVGVPFASAGKGKEFVRVRNRRAPRTTKRRK
jgi:YidC/Oxa1 family membrane protein insertase